MDRRNVRAHSYSWADTWLAFTTDMDDVALIVISAGCPPENLAQTRLTSAADYHFDLEAPIDYPGTLESSARAAPEGKSSWTPRPTRHPWAEASSCETTTATGPQRVRLYFGPH